MGISDPDSLLECPPSYICDAEGSSVFRKIACALGYYCPAGTSKPDQYPCPAGTYSNSYEATAESDCKLCPRGYACGKGYTIAKFLGLPCEPGYYCPRGTPAVDTGSGYAATTYPCPAGTYRAAQGARRLEDCLPCPNGNYCEKGTKTPTSCPEGYYCPLGTKPDTKFPCRPGTYSSTKGLTNQEKCLLCGLGKFCVGGKTASEACPAGEYNNFSEEASECRKCPAGSYCEKTGTVDPKPCDKGFYSEEGASVCIGCENGHFCPETGMSKDLMLSSFRCYAGMFCSDTSQKNVYPALSSHGCTAGYYCPEATLEEIPCPPGTYNPFTGRGSLEECFVVPAGHYTSNPASTKYYKCATGHFCLSGSSSPNQYPCPAGTFRKLKAGSTPEDCALCWSGHKCPEGTTDPEPCPEGYYCPLGTTIPEACPEGTYSDVQYLYDSQACTPCPPGRYCPKRGLTKATEDCDEGFYCMGGSKRPEPTDKITGNLCPKTGYCPKGAEQPKPCEAGTYVIIEGAHSQDQCVPCLPGYYCDGELKEQPTAKCDPGYYCGQGESIRNRCKVEIGEYAGLGSRHPYKCEFGTFAATSGKASCDGCDAGSSCIGIGQSKKDPCPKGYYCPAYTWFQDRGLTYDKFPCPQGTYNAKEGSSSISDCLPCDAGKYCGTRGRPMISGYCKAGFYCLKGSPYKKPPKTSETDYGICMEGHYCPKGIPSPIPCPLGTYSGTFNFNS
jgi:hypothetical protein